MKLSVSTLIITLLATFAIASGVVHEEHNLRGDVAPRELEDNGGAASYYSVAEEDADDASEYYTETTSTEDNSTTSTTFQDKTKDYVVSHAQTSYSENAAEWDKEQWLFFCYGNVCIWWTIFPLLSILCITMLL